MEQSQLELNVSLAADSIRSQLITQMGDMTGWDLSRKSGISHNTIYRIMSGQPPTVTSLVTIFSALGVNEVTIRW